MKKGILALMICFVILNFKVFAADGDLLVNGNVGIGTTSPGGTLGIVSTTQLRAVDIDFPTNRWGLMFRRGSTDLAGFHANNGIQTLHSIPGIWCLAGNVGINVTNTAGYTLYVAGPVMAANYYSYSDISLKTNISPISNPMALIQGLQGVRFDWKEGEAVLEKYEKSRQIGLIAEDIEKVIPEIVRTDTNGYKAVAYDKLTVVLIEALKQQQNQIDELKQAVQSLQGK